MKKKKGNPNQKRVKTSYDRPYTLDRLFIMLFALAIPVMFIAAPIYQVITSENLIAKEKTKPSLVSSELIDSGEDAVIEEFSSDAITEAFSFGKLFAVTKAEKYSYENMLNDIDYLSKYYGDYFTLDSIGTTADDRELLHLVIGNPAAEKEIFINASTHAREYITSQLVMKQCAYYLYQIDENMMYKDIPYIDMWNSVKLHFVPMVNPDGVSISQYGYDGINNDGIKDMIEEIAELDETEISEEYFDRWKANALGVDINRNFNAYWNEYEGREHISSEYYKGKYYDSELETKALVELTNASDFLYTISYHVQGECIYWRFEGINSIEKIAADWVNEIADVTGYNIYSDYDLYDPAGYSDWAIYEKHIPSITLEVGKGVAPYLDDQFDTIWEQNKNIWELTIERAIKR